MCVDMLIIRVWQISDLLSGDHTDKLSQVASCCWTPLWTAAAGERLQCKVFRCWKSFSQKLNSSIGASVKTLSEQCNSNSSQELPYHGTIGEGDTNEMVRHKILWNLSKLQITSSRSAQYLEYTVPT